MNNQQRFPSIAGLPVWFENDHLLVVNKPSGLLSQPGRYEADSAVSRVQKARPEATGPVLVHRLDMDTSGLLLMAKNRSVHRALQQQFERRQIGKCYRALLVRPPAGLASGGLINLPLRLDVDNRPRQLVCPKHGKFAKTVWHRADSDQRSSAGNVTVLLYPLTGRTHQLRVHAAHAQGLAAAVVGDRLYGSSGGSPVERMLLHAEYLAFTDPATGLRHRIRCPASFETGHSMSIDSVL